MSNSELLNRFKTAYANVALHNQKLAGFYVAEYWDYMNHGWKWHLIDEDVVYEIEKDSMYQSNL